MTPNEWTFRPSTPDDRDFIVGLTRDAMGPYLQATFGWDEAAQKTYFGEGFDPSGGQIIQVDGVDVGELAIDEHADEVFVARIALLPEWQGRGIGSSIMRSILDRAANSGRAVTLQVFHSNPRAGHLYESLGFVRTGEDETQVFLRRDIRVCGSVSEAEVIASFLCGELESDRWRRQLQKLLAADGRDPTVLSAADITNEEENRFRETLLDRHRGWLKREGLFGGFPEDVEWFRATLAREQVLRTLYINWDWWLRISSGTRHPLEAARRIRAGEIPGSTAEWHEPVAARLQSDDPPPELIVVSTRNLSKLVVLEGHVRLTAYALFPERLPDALPVYLGVSDEMKRWSEF